MSADSLRVHPSRGLRFTDTFLQLFCEKNSDGTKKLRLKGNELQQRFQERLKPLDMPQVAKFLKKHPEVNELDISYNPIEDEGLGYLCDEFLKHENSLQHLILIGCDIKVEGTRALYFAAETGNMKLKTLRLNGNRIGPQGGHLTALLAPFMPMLEYLDVADTDQTAYSIDAMFLHIYRTPLKIIDVSRPVPETIKSQIDNCFLASSLTEMIRMSTLVELHAQKCDLDGHDAEIIATVLKSSKTLRFLDIGYNNICCVGAEYLGEALKTRPMLLGLCIAGNAVKNRGANTLSDCLPFSRVRYLDISRNKIGEEGILRILNSIKKPYMMRFLLLWGNQITPPIIKIIDRMLKSKVFDEDRIDVRVYNVNGVLEVGHNPVDKYKHRMYGVTDYGCAPTLKIKRNRIETQDDKPRALVNFKHIDRYPPIEDPKQVETSEKRDPGQVEKSEKRSLEQVEKSERHSSIEPSWSVEEDEFFV